ncbi:MAG: hypothetical protein J7527_12880 [Chitinophagaceae bacterium]|nr:hypothetical protein [Chitinophagaceae bacterium]
MMKVAHHNKVMLDFGDDMLKQAERFEKDRELDEAAKLYLQYLRKLPASEYAFSRLMIIYRKQGKRDKELEIIERGIKTFQEIFRKRTKVSPTKKTVEISKKLLKAMGMADSKGIELNEREPLRKWKKRKELLERKKQPEKKR